MTTEDPFDTNFENILTVFVPPPPYWLGAVAIFAYALKINFWVNTIIFQSIIQNEVVTIFSKRRANYQMLNSAQ